MKKLVKFVVIFLCCYQSQTYAMLKRFNFLPKAKDELIKALFKKDQSNPFKKKYLEKLETFDNNIAQEKKVLKGLMFYNEHPNHIENSKKSLVFWQKEKEGLALKMGKWENCGSIAIASPDGSLIFGVVKNGYKESITVRDAEGVIATIETSFALIQFMSCMKDGLLVTGLVSTGGLEKQETHNFRLPTSLDELSNISIQEIRAPKITLDTLFLGFLTVGAATGILSLLQILRLI
jgi:hypothetical protein